MAKTANIMKITGRTALTGELYGGDLRPSSIVVPTGPKGIPYPHCVHSLRAGDIGLFDQLMQIGKECIGNPKADEETLQFDVYIDYRDFPKQDYNCIGCNYNSERDDEQEAHRIEQTGDVAHKLNADCA